MAFDCFKFSFRFDEFIHPFRHSFTPSFRCKNSATEGRLSQPRVWSVKFCVRGVAAYGNFFKLSHYSTLVSTKTITIVRRARRSWSAASGSTANDFR